VQRKIHLSPPPLFSETKIFTSGNELPVFETRYGLVGIQICRDFWLFPELSRILALKGVRIIINTTASPSGADRPFYMRQQTGCRATENMVYAASSNMVGKEVNISYYGHSCILGPNMPKMASIFAEGGEGEEIVSATLNMERLRLFHEALAWDNKDYRLDLISREFQAVR
jgi:predicted amidohydrolase